MNAKPLTLDDWIKHGEGHPLTVEVTGQVAEGSSSGPDAPPIGAWITRKLQLDPGIKNDSICLVDGGWLPLIYCLGGTNIFVDKNTVAEIKARFEDGKLKSDGVGLQDFFEMLAQKACSCTLNPLPSALEGNIKSFPCADVVLRQFQSALADLTRALPHIKIWPRSPYSRDLLEATLASYQADFSQGMKFLQRVGPSLMAPIGRDKRRAAFSRVIQAAKDIGVSPQHICVTVVLSALAAPQEFNPAKQVLKPAAEYGEPKAYNAMWDLFMLTLLRHFHVHHPEHRSALLTRDKNLAFLWMGMKYQMPGSDNGKISQVVFDPRLLNLKPDEVELLVELLGDSYIGYERPVT